jgi:hypothetical protein
MRRVFIGALDGLATHDWLPDLGILARAVGA